VSRAIHFCGRRLCLLNSRVQVYIEPRDAWVGVFVAVGAVYVCLLPFVVIRVDRGVTSRRMSTERNPDVAR
jgi:hypothetical protein